MTENQNQQHTDQEAREKVWAMIKDVKVATMVTQASHGVGATGGNRLRARPMVAVNRDSFHNDLWFFTRIDSGKVEEIAANEQICLSYAEPNDQNYVSISGAAAIVRDKATIKDLWREPMRTWFPKGTEDPEIALIRVVPEAAEYWDSPNSAFVYAYGYLKARLTGQMPNPGDHASISM